MCGICGLYNFENQTPVIRENIEGTTKTMVHRGPDGEGFFISGSLGFGFRRLTIIDLEGGHQPVTDKDKSVWVVLNGEIYNFPELRRERLFIIQLLRRNWANYPIIFLFWLKKRYERH